MNVKDKVDAFLNYVEKHLEKHDFSMQTHEGPAVKVNGIECSGYFALADGILAFATGVELETWLGVAAHEYAHFTQYLDQCKAWTDCFIHNEDVSVYVDLWVEGHDFPHLDIRQYVRLVQLLELDNERRTVEIIKEFDLPICIQDYKKKANAYIHFHNCMYKNRSWFKDGYRMRCDPVILELAAPRLDSQFLRTPKKLESYFEEYCI